MLNWPFKNLVLQSGTGSGSTFDPASIIFRFMVGERQKNLTGWMSALSDGIFKALSSTDIRLSSCNHCCWLAAAAGTLLHGHL